MAIGECSHVMREACSDEGASQIFYFLGRYSLFFALIGMYATFPAERNCHSRRPCFQSHLL